MTKSEMIHIEENDEFWRLIKLAKISADMKQEIIKDRFEYLWTKYKPSDEHIKARLNMSRRERNGR